jgi:hypothetical protein
MFTSDARFPSEQRETALIKLAKDQNTVKRSLTQIRQQTLLLTMPSSEVTLFQKSLPVKNNME